MKWLDGTEWQLWTQSNKDDRLSAINSPPSPKDNRFTVDLIGRWWRRHDNCISSMRTRTTAFRRSLRLAGKNGEGGTARRGVSRGITVDRDANKELALEVDSVSGGRFTQQHRADTTSLHATLAQYEVKGINTQTVTWCRSNQGLCDDDSIALN